MNQPANRKIVRSEVVLSRFSFYTDDEKKNELSVCNIQSIDTLDASKRQIPGGLYDPSLGPIDQHTICQTCNMNYMQCPGHPGHIELDVPVYHPLFFTDLVRVLRAKCVYCHRLRCSMQKERFYLIRLKLLEMGDIQSSDQLLDLVAPPQLFVEGEGKSKSKDTAISSDVESKLRQYERRFEIFQAKNKDKRRDVNIQMKDKQRDLVDSFMKSVLATKRCENCGGFSPAFRKDASSKIFQKPLQKKQRKSMSVLRLKYSSALKKVHGQGNDSDEEMDMEDEEEEHSNENTDNEESDDALEGGKKPEVNEADKYIAPLEVEAQIKLLWQQSGEILNFIWGRALGEDVTKINLVTLLSWKLFFTRVLLVPPNRFRPAAIVGEMISDHPANVHLKRILTCNSKIRLLQNTSSSSATSLSALIGGNAEEVLDIDVPAQPSDDTLSRLISEWIELQVNVNCYIDSSKDPNPLGNKAAPMGFKQVLERKEGLFRRHMMGKRVNYCARSVISPDPYIGMNEIGIPLRFAKELHYAVPVTEWNVKHLRKLVERGPQEYPGANMIETPDGKLIKLDKLSAMERAGKAKLLLQQPGTKVYRHLIDGDALLINRQPTLHKPGIMAHKARVYHYVREQTLRMNYANCNAYNADFDGDEINCHFVQSELARAEAYFICNTDNQYIVPTSGNPLRGLIQDHVASAVKLTCKDTFLTRSEFQQLVFISVYGLSGTEIINPHDDIRLPPPTIWKPTPLWTGKQVITALLAQLCRLPLPPLQLHGKARTPAFAFGADHMENEVIIRQGELLGGVLDKNAIGNVSLGIVHAVYELYGAEMAGLLLNAFSRLFTYYLQDAGQSCGIEDLVLTVDADKERNRLLIKVNEDAQKGLLNFLSEHAEHEQQQQQSTSKDQKQTPEERLALMFANDRKGAKIQVDSAMQAVINQSASDVIKACLPNGLERPFRTNHFSMMVLTGAKGSAVNQSQISAFLGQQALEGQRVPMMVSGKTLPSFMAYDGSARAGGFVRDRFLTGVKPQEYYFHCMAGREGLVDTAVKTSRSGYLQRCLVKHLEELKVGYDMTVRDSSANVIQFCYGDDGLDPMQANLLGGKNDQMMFLAKNNQALAYKYSLHEDFFAQGIEMDSASKYHALLKKAKEVLLQQGNSLFHDYSTLSKGQVILARKKTRLEHGWERNNLSKTWSPAEILRVRSKDHTLFPTLDIQYADGTVEKKVPVAIMMQSRPGAGGHESSSPSVPLPVFVIKIGLPDTPMSCLRLGSCVGAISEKIQDSVMDYIAKNPDGVITSVGSDSTVTAEALELLVWIKYMRSLANPGEAVGCVAAQSIGEPSTQMTLNTFHLAGHGGANVTLGIPRLREIIMTASKTLKTPTMLIPLTTGRTIESAKALARKLSQLTLAELIHHKKGIEVGEIITRQTIVSRWERQYRIRLQFQSRSKIEESFGLTFEMILATVKHAFLRKLDALIKLEQRRTGDSTASKNDPLKAFRAAAGSGDHIPRRSSGEGKSGDEQDDGEGENRQRRGQYNKLDDQAAFDEDAAYEKFLEVEESFAKTNGGGKGGKKSGDGYASEEDEEESDDENDSMEVEERPKEKTNRSKEVMGYDDEDEDEEEEVEEGGDSEELEQFLQEEDAKNAHGKGSKSVSFGEEKTGNKTPSKSKSKSTASSSSGSGTTTDKETHNFSYNSEEGWMEITVHYSVYNRRLLMVQLVEKAAALTCIRATKHISKAYGIVDTTSKSPCVQTEGVNFEAIWALPDTLVEYNSISCNDIWQILDTFGVEAARQTIVKEIQAVFEVYGINVNPRHLSLIGDFMTRTGSYIAMNRIGMRACPSPYLQMSFETTCAFLTKAAQEGYVDNQQSPSANIVLGSVPKLGTGCFDLMLPLK